MVEKTKDSNAGMIVAIAAGALAVGYLVYRGLKSDDKGAVDDAVSTIDAADQGGEEVKQDDELENAYFIEKTESAESQ